MQSLRQRCTSEMLGTLSLVFIGTLAIVVNNEFDGVVSHLGIAIAFGLVVMTMIYAIGDVSGAHINPAVTIAFWVARRFPGNEVGPYIASQLIGAVLASVLVRVMFPQDTVLGATLPGTDVGIAQAFVAEVCFTFLLMFVILGVSTGAKEKGVMAGVAVGALVLLAALIAGPISGASLNPAGRSARQSSRYRTTSPGISSCSCTSLPRRSEQAELCWAAAVCGRKIVARERPQFAASLNVTEASCLSTA
jgi:aquaporin Z